MKTRGVVSATLLLTFSTSLAWAVFGIGDVVIDPTNLIQTTVTALNSVKEVANQAKSLVNEATQIANQIKQLENDVTNLTQIPLHMSNELHDVLTQYQEVMSQVQGLSYDYHSIRDQFERLFSAPRSGQPVSLPSYTAQLMTQIRQASGQAVQAQAILQRLASQRSAMKRALAASESARGNLEVQQASNQLSGVLAAQQANLLEVLTTTSRAQVSFIAAQTALDEAARANADNAMRNWGVCSSCNEGLRALPSLR